MAFEKVKKNTRVGRGSAEPMISIRASNTIGVNKPAMQEYFEDATHIVLHYDKDTSQLALEADKGEDEDGYKLSRSNGSGALGCSAFVKNNGLSGTDESRQYTPYEDTIDDGTEVVMIDVDDPDSTVTTSSPSDDDKEDTEE